MLPPPPIVQPDPSLTPDPPPPPPPGGPGRAAWGADLVDRDGNRWAICTCHHLDRDSALRCARTRLERRAQRAFEAYSRAITRTYGAEAPPPPPPQDHPPPTQNARVPLAAQDAWIAAAEDLRRDP